MAAAQPDHWVGGEGVGPGIRQRVLGEEEGLAVEAGLAAPSGVEGGAGGGACCTGGVCRLAWHLWPPAMADLRTPH